MDSYEFMRSITHDLGSIKIFFDATMALYQIVNGYNGFTVINQDVDDTYAVFTYTIAPPQDNPEMVDKYIKHINGLCVGMYGRVYMCEASMVNPNVLMVVLHLSQ